MTKRSPTQIQHPPFPGVQPPPAFIDPQAEMALQTAENKALFLLLYEKTWNRTEAARETGITMRQVRQWEALDPDFAERVSDVQAAVMDGIEAAVKGIVMDEKNSPNARIAAAKLLLEGNRPEKYRRGTESGPRIATQNVFILGAPPKALPDGPIIDAEVTHVENPR